jgi:hypothetical protein
MKGKENVFTEVNLMMMCYNIRRLMYILYLNAFHPNRVEISHFFKNMNNCKIERRNYLMPLKAFY